MSPPSFFKWDVTFGNVLSIITIVVTIAISWQALNSRVTALEEEKSRATENIEKLKDERDRITRIEEKLIFIQQSLARLERRLDERQAEKMPN
jgi:DNA repair exonuclease SbcCD ATPase subunit